MRLRSRKALVAAQAHGNHFRYPEIDVALRGILGEGSEPVR